MEMRAKAWFSVGIRYELDASGSIDISVYGQQLEKLVRTWLRDTRWMEDWTPLLKTFGEKVKK